MNNFFKTQAIFYDMDGILVDSEPLWEEAVKESLAHNGVDYDELHRMYNIITTGSRIDQLVDIYCQIVPEKNINPQRMVNEVIDLVIDKTLTHKPILPGVIESLTLCREFGLKIGLASSSPMRVIDAITDCLNITNHFDIRVSAEHLEYGKPHPAVYLLAAEKIDTNPLNCLTIEDSFVGMIATKAARMKSIVIPALEERNNPQWCLADYQLSSLLELNEMHFK